MTESGKTGRLELHKGDVVLVQTKVDFMVVEADEGEVVTVRRILADGTVDEKTHRMPRLRVIGVFVRAGGGNEHS